LKVTNTSTPYGTQKVVENTTRLARIMSAKAKRKSSDTNESIKIRVHAADPDIDPVVCSFPGGLPSSLLTASNGSSNTTSSHPPKFLWRRPASDKTKAGGTLIGKDDACLFESQAPQQGKNKCRTKLCVGVYDKKKGKLTLHQAASDGTVYALQQSVPSYLEQAGPNVDSTKTYAEQRTALFEDFGSAKKRKVMRSQEANKVNVDSVVGAGNVMVGSFLKGEAMSESNRKAIEERINQTAEQGEGNQAKIKDAVDTATKEWRNSFLPKHEEDAAEAHEVYNARDMLGDEAWGQVSRVVDACMRKEDVAEALLRGSSEGTEEKDDGRKRTEWNKCVVDLISDVPTESPSAKHQYKSAVALNYFINLYIQNNKRRFIRRPPEGKAHWFGTPVTVINRFMECFATQITNEDGELCFVMSKANKDKCCVHMLLLFVMADGGKTMKSGNIKPIADDLSMDVRDSAHLLKLAGCTVAKKAGTNKTSAILQVPLKFPALKKAGARGGR
jgi:hypothetical protein